ncbi:hypothetical protein CCR75_008032 [Bremia lactucae]|uniref:Uncharacterized protein n=1 Tax=Bremia lactucae TaxID=4779 RepID=A0A976IB25_BRELC|nr:hypothetical protein CCR75_008032 [Bremia lactucae]
MLYIYKTSTLKVKRDRAMMGFQDNKGGDNGNTFNEKYHSDAEGPPRKMSRLRKDICSKPTFVASNQDIVSAFADSGEHHLCQRNTGKVVAQLRAARAIRDSPNAITSAADALTVRSV